MGLFTERDEETPNQIIIGKLNRIEAKLDAVIKAMHDYDGDEWSEPNDALKEAAAQYNERIHHVSNEEADEDAFDDYGQRVVKDKNNPDDKRTVGNKKQSAVAKHERYRQPHKH
jgi:phage terminase small subunit